VNVTSLTAFAKCPRQYYLQRYLGWSGGRFARFDAEDSEELLPDTGELDVSAAEMGSFVHEVLAGKPGPHPPEAQELADVFLRSDLGLRAKNATSSKREWEFIADVGGTLVRGSVDLWFEENGEIQLVDYKTDAKPNPAEYAPQLALYALAIERAIGKRPVAALLHYLRADKIAPVLIDDAALNRARELITELGQAQNTLRFDLREGGHCHSCQFYRSMCPSQA
jgi:CRISPR/Cas system-associated exonuclease Cas4 (RecB family)